MATRNLHLTTPLMHGSDVSDLQTRLHRAGWYHGKIDGQYGLLTAQAVYRAQFWIGYAKPNQTAGPAFIKFLTGEARPTEPMRARRKQRMAKKNSAPPIRTKALGYLRKHLGEKESPPGSNRIGFASLWYGIIGPWCAMAVTRAYVEAGSKAFVKGRRYSYVPTMVADARAGRNHLTVTKNPQPGDIATYDWDNDGEADHTGLFERWDRHGVTFEAVEGNTAIGNDSNGGEVMRRVRSVSDVQVFIHVGG